MHGSVIQCSAVADPTGAACQLLTPQPTSPHCPSILWQTSWLQRSLRLVLAPCVIHRFLARPPRERQRPGRQWVLGEVGRDSMT